MINSTYLIKSRHDIFYFRYPLPIAKNNNNLRVSVSLGTCFPKNALRISKTLEYYSLKLL